MNHKINIIVAISNNNVIGKNNTIPWYYPEDLKYFKICTTYHPLGHKNIMVMGYNTWTSINKTFNDRLMIVLTTKQIANQENVYFYNNIMDALFGIDYLRNNSNTKYGDLFFIGGRKIYEHCMEYLEVDNIYLTKIDKEYEGDVYFPNIDSTKFYIDSIKKSNEYDEISYYIYKKFKNEDKHGEFGYLNLIKTVLNNGQMCEDRTGTGIISYYGTQTRYDLSKGFPLLTTKKMFIRGIIEELLWFLKGETDNNKLKDKGVHIWDGNTSRDFLDKLGFNNREEGDGGPIYGFNFRHYGAEYIDCHTDYSGKGIDQVKEVLRLIKEEPNSRRIIINLWDPTKLPDMVLPPCHMVYQFRVYNNKLSCMLYQRSGDVGLGVPFNIASASLMTHIFAKLSGLEVGELIHTIADAHIYKNHIEQLNKQILRKPLCFPKLDILERGQDKVEDFQYEDFKIIGYESHDALKMKMAV